MMHEKSKLRQERQFRDWCAQYGPRSGAIDELLDQYNDSLYRATEWDADKWGLPDEAVCAVEPTTPPESWASGLGHLARSAPRGRDGHLEHWPTEPAKWEL